MDVEQMTWTIPMISTPCRGAWLGRRNLKSDDVKHQPVGSHTCYQIPKTTLALPRKIVIIQCYPELFLLFLET